jgi:acetyltransferase-like isoleucine patch superfamily enzyme
VLQQGLALAVGYAAFLHAFVLVLGCLKRVFQPKLRPSHSEVGGNRGFVAWGLNSVFQGVFLSSFVHDQVHFVFWLRFLYYRLMGMRLHPGVILGTGAVLRQVELIELGRGSVIGIGATLSCHVNRDGGTHYQAPVRVGARSLIGTLAAVGPGCTIGEGCVVGARATLPMGVTVGDGASVGPSVVVKPNTTIGAGARVLSCSLVLADVPAGETWSGTPARRVSGPSEEPAS